MNRCNYPVCPIDLIDAIAQTIESCELMAVQRLSSHGFKSISDNITSSINISNLVTKNRSHVNDTQR